MDDAWIRFNVNYYLREKCYGKARSILEDSSTKFSNQSELNFYHGISHILEGQIQNGILELTVLQNDKDINVAVLLALVYGYKSTSSADRDSILSLESRLKEEKKQASAKSLYYAGLFLSLAGKFEKAADYTNKSLRKDPNNVDTLLLKSWIDFSTSKEMQMATLDCLELALSRSNKNPEALLGLARFKYLAKDFEASNLTLDRLIVSGPGQVVPLVEKMRNEFAMQKWEMVLDTLERIQTLDPDNIEAFKIRIFIALCKNSDYIEAVDQLNKLYSVLENIETYNGYQFHNTAQVFSKICSRSSSVLTQVYRFAKYASEIYPSNVEYMSEVGYQCILQGKVKDASSFFKAASKIDSNSINALCGLTLCQIAESGATEQVSQQIELLFEMQGSTKQPILYLVSAKINEKISSNAVPLLNEASETKMFYAKRYPYSLAHVKELDPDFLLEVYKEYKNHLPKKPTIVVGYLMYTQDANNSLANHCFRILETICKTCPGLISALHELAKLKFLFGFANEAQKLAVQIGELDNTHAGSQLILAQIYIQQQSFTKASRCLESCLSYNFKVKDSALYNFLQGIICKSNNQSKEALTSLATSLSILNNKNASVSKQFDSDLNIIDKATLYLMIIELQSTLGLSEVGITMQEAIQELSYTTEEPRLQIARADISLNKGEVDKAIDILNEVKPGQPYYFQAHTKLAHIYLKEKNDREMFTTCFKEVVSNHPMADAHTLMGDAFMSINEPIQAASSYETALREDSKNIQLIKKLGTALVKTHEYDKAIQHYETAIRRLNDDELKLNYVDLLAKLKQYDKADATLSEELSNPRNKEKDVLTMKRRVKLLQKQAQIREMKDPTVGNTTLILAEAKELQSVVVRRLDIDGHADIQDEKRELSSILCTLAKAKSSREPATAANLYAEALLYSPRDPNTLLLLAKLYAQMNNPEKCEQTLSVLLNADPNNEAAAVMMADLAFRKVDLEAALRHLTQCLSISSHRWSALATAIELHARRGDAAAAEGGLHAASEGGEGEPGYHYCAGLYAMYTGKPNVALREFNTCRRSAKFGALAAKKMALLCLSQHADGLTDGVLTNGDGDTRQLAIRTAEKLLPEISASERRGVQALVTVATRQKPAAERVLQEYLPAITDESCQDDPYLILAIANAYNILKQPTRAKNILKRTISAIPWTPENADGLERCWLEVAEHQISSGRADAARELLTKILNHNKSCSTAYQYLGQLAEKDQSYRVAAPHYENAWIHSGKTNLAVGFKLAHAYLKLKKYPECIVVCRSVLNIHPDYPKLRKDILEKAKNNLRT